MRLLALDPATKTGFAVGKPGGTPILGVKNLRRTPDENPVDIFKRARHWFDELLLEHHPDRLIIEGMVYTFGDTNHATTAISRGLHGIFVSVDVPVTVVSHLTWRKWVFGKGNLPGAESKRLMRLICQAKKWEAKDHNAAEAAGLWLWGCSQVDPRLTHRIEPLFLSG